MHRSLLLAFGAWVLLPLLVRAQTPADSGTERALAVLLQIAGSLEENVTSGELGQVHNEDSFLYSALSRLSLDAPAEQRKETGARVAAVARSVAELHEAADAFDRSLAVKRLPATLEAVDALAGLFAPEVVAAARERARRFTCPMHPDVVGARHEACPKCGMPLDTRARVLLQRGPAAATRPSTVTAAVCTEEPLRVGQPARGILRLQSILDQPLLLKDLREVHTQKIHLLIVDPTLSDYHHEHPIPTDVPGEYAFTFTPRVAGPYRTFADLQPLLSGFQEYAPATLAAGTIGGDRVQKSYPTEGVQGGIRYQLTLDAEHVRANTPVGAHVRVTRDGKPFTQLEPLMAAFAHLVGFHEDGKTVLHLHPIESRALTPDDRGGPDLAFRIYAETPGFYRLFLQTQVGGASQFIPFGIDVLP